MATRSMRAPKPDRCRNQITFGISVNVAHQPTVQYNRRSSRPRGSVAGWLAVGEIASSPTTRQRALGSEYSVLEWNVVAGKESLGRADGAMRTFRRGALASPGRGASGQMRAVARVVLLGNTRLDCLCTSRYVTPQLSGSCPRWIRTTAGIWW